MPASSVIDASSLLDTARRTAHHAYAPYSHFPVGAAILTEDGELFTGCNVENASYPVCTCAERGALSAMVASGYQGHIDSVAVVGLEASPCWPCGMCRQALREFHCRTVIVENSRGEALIKNFSDLLPESFGPDALIASQTR